MTRIWIKKAPLCLALTLFALPAMADNIFSGVVNFGREILDETRKLAPGIQNDRRNETPKDARAALDDGRDRPAIESPSANRSNIELAPPVNGQPTGSNLNYTYGESQRSANPQGYNSNAGSTNTNDSYGSDQGYNQDANQGQQQQAPQSNFGWQEESNL
ncbi:hypothetical protein [Oceanisphaera sp. IT1-181]|uniref:hypothetical protein n=1 Tax=Oceanisphaera sp. IT1-181 TaxID=3081199 RepID=UPI0029CA3415|nr:hypothetical protein [Oceanisphaera sp. IT1-181]